MRLDERDALTLVARRHDVQTVFGVDIHYIVRASAERYTVVQMQLFDLQLQIVAARTFAVYVQVPVGMLFSHPFPAVNEHIESLWGFQSAHGDSLFASIVCYAAFRLLNKVGYHAYMLRFLIVLRIAVCKAYYCVSTAFHGIKKAVIWRELASRMRLIHLFRPCAT